MDITWETGDLRERKKEGKGWERGPGDPKTYEFGRRGREEFMVDLKDEYRIGNVSQEEYRAEVKRLTGE